MATKLEQQMAAERMAEDERGSKGKATAQIPASSEQKQKLKELGLTGVLTVVPGGFILKGVKGASKVYKTIDAARKAAEVAGKIERNLPTKTNKSLTTTSGRSVTTTSGRSVTTTGGRNATKTGGRNATKTGGRNATKTVGRNEKVVGVSKEGTRAASRASQVGTAGTENKNKKLKPVPEVNVRTLPEPKTVPEPKAKTKTAPKPKPKPKEKFDTEGGLYKQYEFAKKRDLPIGGATQKYYDQMENVALNKKGGMIKKSAVKKRKGFSGRGAGAARRGF